MRVSCVTIASTWKNWWLKCAFNLAAKVGYPVVPVSVVGTNKIMPKGTFRLKPGLVHLHLDKPVPVEKVKNRNDEIELMNSVRDIIVANHKRISAGMNF